MAMVVVPSMVWWCFHLRSGGVSCGAFTCRHNRAPNFRGPKRSIHVLFKKLIYGLIGFTVGLGLGLTLLYYYLFFIIFWVYVFSIYGPVLLPSMVWWRFRLWSGGVSIYGLVTLTLTLLNINSFRTYL